MTTFEEYYQRYGPYYVQMQVGSLKTKWRLYPKEAEGYENQRQIFPDEIVIDAETSEETFLQKIREKLKPYSYTEWYSGGRGHHFHLFFPQLLETMKAELRPIAKKVLTEHILGELFSSELIDKQRSSNKCLIQAENTRHRNSPHNIKKLITVHDVGLNKIPQEVLEQIDKFDIFVPAETLIATSPEITKIEDSCKFIKDRLQRTDLNNRERFFLMATYLKLGDLGEARLREIISHQHNYNEAKTDLIINSYKKQGKFYGVSCKTLIKEGYCNDTKCKLRKKVKL